MTESVNTPASAVEELSRLLQVGVDSVAGEIGYILAGLAAVGLFSLAVVNLVKATCYPRYYFQRTMVRAFLARRVSRLQDNELMAEQLFERVTDLEGFIVQSAVGDEELLFYEQSGEAVVQQIGTTLDQALASPLNPMNEVALQCFIPASLNGVFEQFQLRTQSLDSDWLQHLRHAGTATDADKEQRRQQVQSQEALKVQLSSAINAHLSGLALRLEYFWTLFLQGMAICVSAITIYFIGGFTPGYLLLAVFGGFVAPIAHDLLSGFKAAQRKI